MTHSLPIIVAYADSVTFLIPTLVELAPAYVDHVEGLLGLYDAELDVINVIITIVNGKK